MVLSNFHSFYHTVIQKESGMVGPPSRKMLHATLQKPLRNDQRNMTKSSMHQPDVEIPQISDKASVGRAGTLFCNPQDSRIYCQCSGARNHKKLPEVLCPCLHRSRAPAWIRLGSDLLRDGHRTSGCQQFPQKLNWLGIQVIWRSGRGLEVLSHSP